MRSTINKGAGLLFALLFLFTSVVHAEITPEGYYRSPLQINQDRYIGIYGNDQFPRNQNYGIVIEVHEESVSPTWVNIDVKIAETIQRERKISKFYILGNNKIIDEFYPQFYDLDEDGTIDYYNEWYKVKPTFFEAIGSNVSFRAIAVESDLESNYEYIVAWSKESEAIWFDPLPVTDRETHTWLELILRALEALLAKLQELLNTLSQKLDQLKKAVEDIYTPRPETLQKFDQAVNNLMEKMPFNELTESANEIQDSYNNARNQLKQPNSKIGFGGRFCFIPGYQETCVENILDLTEFEKEVKLLREVMRAMIWLYFFHMLFMWMRPKMRF